MRVKHDLTTNEVTITLSVDHATKLAAYCGISNLALEENHEDVPIFQAIDREILVALEPHFQEKQKIYAENYYKGVTQ